MADISVGRQIQEIKARLLSLAKKQKQRILDLKAKLLLEQSLRQQTQQQALMQMPQMPGIARQDMATQMDVEALKKRLQEEMSKNAQLVRNQNFDTDRAALEAEITALKKQLTEEFAKSRKFDFGQFQSEKASLEAQVTAMKKQLSEEIEKAAKLSTISTDINSIRLSSEAEIKALKGQLGEEISKAAKNKAESDNALAEMSNKMKEIQEMANRSRMRMEKHQEEAQQAREQMEVYQKENQKLLQYQKRDESIIHNLKKEIEKQENLVKEKAAEIKVLNKKIQELADDIVRISQNSHAFHMIRLEHAVDDIRYVIDDYVAKAEQELMKKGMKELMLIKNEVYDFNKVNEQVFANLFHKIGEMELNLKNHTIREVKGQDLGQ